MNGVSGSGSNPPYLQKKDDDDVKKATNEAAKSIEKPKPYEYGTAEKAIDVIDFIATTQPLFDKTLVTFVKAVANNHTDASLGHKVGEATKELVKEKCDELVKHGVVETVAEFAAMHSPIGVAGAALIMTHDLAAKGTAMYVKGDAGLKNAPTHGANEIAAKAGVMVGMKGASEKAEAKKAEAKTPESVVDPSTWMKKLAGK